MFASLKNKIREETGSDISKLTQKITSSTAQRIDSLRGRSVQGSTSSINSLVSSDGVRDDSSGESIEELKRKVQRLEVEYSRKLEDKDKELKETVNDRDKRIQNLEKEKDEAYKQINNLKGTLRNAEGKDY